jgi:hypothetical protein
MEKERKKEKNEVFVVGLLCFCSRKDREPQIAQLERVFFPPSPKFQGKVRVWKREVGAPRKVGASESRCKHHFFCSFLPSHFSSSSLLFLVSATHLLLPLSSSVAFLNSHLFLQ